MTKPSKLSNPILAANPIQCACGCAKMYCVKHRLVKTNE